MAFLAFLAGVIVGMLVLRMYAGRGKATEPAIPAQLEATPPEQEQAQPGEDRLYELKRAIESNDENIQRPADLLQHNDFNEAVSMLSGEHFTPERLIEYLGTPGYVLPSMAAAAMGRRSDIDPGKVVATIPGLGAYSLHFVLQYLQALPHADNLPSVAAHAREWWWDYTGFRNDFRLYLQWASTKPAAAPGADLAQDLDEPPLAESIAVLQRFRDPVLQPTLDALQRALASKREQRVLGAIGRVGLRSTGAPRFEHDTLRSQIDELHGVLTGATPKPVLLVGESGVGKSALFDLLAKRLSDDGWLLFEASAADILAGQKYIGELEERVRDMRDALRRPKALWHVPDFFDLLNKGSHRQDPRGILDLVLPAIERGELLLLGEITPTQHAQLVLSRPSIRRLFERLQVLPASGQTLDEIVGHWAQAASGRHGREVIGQAELTEATRIAAQFFPEHNEPGRSLRLLDDALVLATQGEPPALPLDGGALLAAVGARSGMPQDVIDPGQPLPLDRLREFFRKRVVGQDDAVDCLVDRIAMLKAGLTDPRRPIGVFLFAGPTGTGKTELAKALGELLFGSDERLLRLDMSEYQSPDAAHRLIADSGAEGTTRSLVSRIREQPFSVILLDEFEKAHTNVWDLFLQVFDEGRLGDQHGNTADFRHSIIILTSNVGSTLSRGAGPGFTTQAGGYSRSTVEKALFETFRREFINRLDRVVLFRPLDRAAMRGILHKELGRALERRGLRNRTWAVEWEPSAIEFLLDKGFTPDLGARPLRRAIEDHLLAPLARSIVEHRAPEGDQFLFVRSAGDRLDVEFIDPDAIAGDAPATAHPHDTTDDLRTLLFAAGDSPPTPAILQPHLDRLASTLSSDGWLSARSADFAAMDAEGFWSDPARFAVLDRIERRDRIESALAGASRLLERLKGHADDTLSLRLTQLLFLLDIAIEDIIEVRAQDAILSISIGEGELARRPVDARRWWQQVLQMYLQWAGRRGMRVDIIEQDAERGHARLSISGFGALRLLEGELGLHVLEHDDGKGTTHRLAVQVSIVADGPGSDPGTAQGSWTQTICRRYRAEPSPLVRDTRRGWRSGRIERVLEGDFDIMPSPERHAGALQ